MNQKQESSDSQVFPLEAGLSWLIHLKSGNRLVAPGENRPGLVPLLRVVRNSEGFPSDIGNSAAGPFSPAKCQE